MPPLEQLKKRDEERRQLEAVGGPYSKATFGEKTTEMVELLMHTFSLSLHIPEASCCIVSSSIGNL